MIFSMTMGVLFQIFLLFLGYDKEFSLMAGMVMAAVMLLSEILRKLEKIYGNQTR